MSMTAKLKKANSLFKKKRTELTKSSGTDEIDDGRYLARLTTAKLGASQSSDRLQITWGYKILDGDFAGKMKYDYMGIESEQGLGFMCRTIAKYGHDLPDDLEDGLEDVLKAILKEKPVVRITVKTNGDFQNTYVNKVLDEDEASEELASGETDEEEEADTDSEDESEEEESEEEGEEEEEEEAEESEEEEEESDDEESADIEVGSKVEIGKGKKAFEATVVKIWKSGDKVDVRDAKGKVTKGVAISDCTLLVDAEEEEEVPETPARKPKPKVKKKTGSK